jgi:hypothetical protein
MCSEPQPRAEREFGYFDGLFCQGPNRVLQTRTIPVNPQMSPKLGFPALTRKGRPKPPPQFQLTGLISTFGTNNWPASAIISCRSFDVRCWQMRTFQLGHFGSE